MDYELTIFSQATNWKKYWSRRINKHVSGFVAEVGAGIGSNTDYLLNEKVEKLILVEPDAKLFGHLIERGIQDKVQYLNGKLGDVSLKLDVIVYVDVLEHIEDDLRETTLAYEVLKEDGYLIIVAPAFAFLYTRFDEAVGHFRRYTKHTLNNSVDSRFRAVSVNYMDSIGLLASLGNKLLLKSAAPSPAQISFWDKCMVPMSEMLDPLMRFSFGKTVIGVYRK